MISMGKSTIVGATCRSCRSVTPLLSGSRAKPTAVTRASTDTKQRSSAVNALADSNSNPWAQPGYLGAVVSQMPEEQQRTVFVGILAAISAGTVVSCSVLGPVISAYLPSFLQVHSNSWFPLGPIFLAAGVAHFTGTTTLQQVTLATVLYPACLNTALILQSPSMTGRQAAILEAACLRQAVAPAVPLELHAQLPGHRATGPLQSICRESSLNRNSQCHHMCCCRGARVQEHVPPPRCLGLLVPAR